MNFDISPAIIGLVFSGALAASAFFFLKKLPSSRDGIPDGTDLLSDDFQRDYQKWEICSLIPICLSMYVVFRLCFRGLTLLSRFSAPPAHNCVFALTVSDGFWVLPAFFLAMVTSAVPCHCLYAFFFKGRYDGKLFYQKLLGGGDGWLFYKRFTACVVGITAVLIPLGINCYIRMTPAEIVINPFFGIFEKRFTYYEVAEIRRDLSVKYVNNRISRVPSHSVKFSGGETWSTRNTLFGMGKDLENEIVRYISIKSGCQVSARAPRPAAGGTLVQWQHRRHGGHP